MGEKATAEGDSLDEDYQLAFYAVHFLDYNDPIFLLPHMRHKPSGTAKAYARTFS